MRQPGSPAYGRGVPARRPDLRSGGGRHLPRRRRGRPGRRRDAGRDPDPRQRARHDRTREGPGRLRRCERAFPGARVGTGGAGAAAGAAAAKRLVAELRSLAVRLRCTARAGGRICAPPSPRARARTPCRSGDAGGGGRNHRPPAAGCAGHPARRRRGHAVRRAPLRHAGQRLAAVQATRCDRPAAPCGGAGVIRATSAHLCPASAGGATSSPQRGGGDRALRRARLRGGTGRSSSGCGTRPACSPRRNSWWV